MARLYSQDVGAATYISYSSNGEIEAAQALIVRKLDVCPRKDEIHHLSERRDMIKYGSLKHGGYQIGSGGIESSNKFISNVRLKRSGAWWCISES